MSLNPKTDDRFRNALSVAGAVMDFAIDQFLSSCSQVSPSCAAMVIALKQIWSVGGNSAKYASPERYEWLEKKFVKNSAKIDETYSKRIDAAKNISDKNERGGAINNTEKWKIGAILKNNEEFASDYNEFAIEYHRGIERGNSTGYDFGSIDGYFEGISDCNNTNVSASYMRGVSAGNTTGYAIGFSAGDKSGHARGFSDGYEAGFERGKRYYAAKNKSDSKATIIIHSLLFAALAFSILYIICDKCRQKIDRSINNCCQRIKNRRRSNKTEESRNSMIASDESPSAEIESLDRVESFDHTTEEMDSRRCIYSSKDEESINDGNSCRATERECSCSIYPDNFVYIELNKDEYVKCASEKRDPSTVYLVPVDIESGRSEDLRRMMKEIRLTGGNLNRP